MADGDGNGWVQCRCGHRHWGRHGAAGLLLVRVPPDDGAARVAGAERGAGAGSAPGTGVAPLEALLQLRAQWTHHGGTWALPGGAADSHEPATSAALREAEEETGVAAGDVRVLGQVVGTDHGDWRYTVVFAEPTPRARPRAANTESDEVRWVPLAQVTALPLHPGFAESWPAVAAALDGALRPAR